ncbi:MAG: T9SS type A sorting domain-containing protein [Bacteroidetes bacterium]|nr:T9SS type A sorting domain-containing protein [Bacteroidota bacterium]
MKKIHLLGLALLSLLSVTVTAQVTFIIDAVPSYTPAEDTVYIAGDFNGWNPGDTAGKMHRNDQGKWEITLPAQSDQTTILFKFTRGSWANVEKGASGEEISNRSFTYGNGLTAHVSILNWADNSGGGTTAASNVIVMSTDFYMPQFDRHRRIWLYFPPDYETSGKDYPVLYMHDGQNLFDSYTSFAGEWEVDETLNNLAGQGYQVPLVVGIDNGGADRIGEYTPWFNPDYGGGDGEKYMQFIVETLKPYIDQHYRTNPDREHTALMGSSLGGLISHYGGLANQEVFSKLGLFSPSYWYSDSIWDFTRQAGKQADMRIYQLCGTNESTGMVGEMQRMNDSLIGIGFQQTNIFNKIVLGGQHNEQLWREAFGEAYLWLFNSFANSINEPGIREIVTVFPNPAANIIYLKTPGNAFYDRLEVSDFQGRQVLTIDRPKSDSIDISSLPPGNYLLKCMKDSALKQLLRFTKN